MDINQLEMAESEQPPLPTLTEALHINSRLSMKAIPSHNKKQLSRNEKTQSCSKYCRCGPNPQFYTANLACILNSNETLDVLPLSHQSQSLTTIDNLSTTQRLSPECLISSSSYQASKNTSLRSPHCSWRKNGPIRRFPHASPVFVPLRRRFSPLHP